MKDGADKLYLEKYKELYTLAKEAFAEELARLARIDDKAAKYLSVITVILGIYGFFTKYAIEKCIPLKGFFDLLLVGIIVLLLVSLVITWYNIFRVLKIDSYAKIPVDLDFFRKNDLTSIYFSLAKGMKENMQKNRKQGDNKVYGSGVPTNW